MIDEVDFRRPTNFSDLVLRADSAQPVQYKGDNIHRFHVHKSLMCMASAFFRDKLIADPGLSELSLDNEPAIKVLIMLYMIYPPQAFIQGTVHLIDMYTSVLIVICVQSRWTPKP